MRRRLLPLALLLGAPLPVVAQSPDNAALIVTVSDPSGATVPDAVVKVTNTATGAAREATTDRDGSATVAALPLTGAYQVVVSKTGFAEETARDVQLRAGETARLGVRLSVSGKEARLTVYGTTSGVRADPELGMRLSGDRIDETPILGRKITALPLQSAAFRTAKGTGDLFINALYFVTGAGGRRQADFVVDGATANEPWGRQTLFATLPVSAVQEMNVQSRAFSAEYGWTSGIAVNIVTRSGTNDTHGEVVGLVRPGGMQSTAFSDKNQCPPSVPRCVAPTEDGQPASILPPDIPDSLGQGSFAIGGPIVKDETHYFVAADYTHQERTAPLTSPLAASSETVGKYDQVLADARLDHAVNGANHLMLRFNLDRFRDTNPQDAISGNSLPSAGRRFERHTYTAQLSETAVLSPSLLNEARLEYLHGVPITAFDPLTPSTRFSRAGSVPFTAGESRFSHVYSRQWQLSDTLSWTGGHHYLRLGGSLARSVSGGDGTEFGSAYTLGLFTVRTSTTVGLDQLTLADMTRYQQSSSFGDSTYELRQWLFALFAQDQLRVARDLTLDLGLRYDRQTFSDGTGNLAPRIGFGWNPGGDPRTAVRGGYGIYYAELRANTDADFELGGPTGIFTYSAAPGQVGFPPCLTCTPVALDPNAVLSTLPPRDITVRPGRASYYSRFFDVSKLPGYASATFESPRSQVWSIGVERELVSRLFVAVDYVGQHWTGIDETVDLNAPSLFVRTAPGQVRSPAAADATRPITPVDGGYRQINVVENLGVADYDGLQTSLRWHYDRADVSVSYTLSKATNTTEPDGNGAGPNDFNKLGEAERGPSLLDQRHRAVVSVLYRFPLGLTAGFVSQLASARPFNATTGTDNNGDGSSRNDRPVIDGAVVSRYAFRGTPTCDADVFVEKRIPLSGRSVTLRFEGFNVFNHADVLGRNGTWGDADTPLPTFGLASPGLANVEPGRMFQLLVRFSF
jgi:Carboxypeptidase regulatory-like domain/TonB dependent receptor-like, beta-barrel